MDEFFYGTLPQDTQDFSQVLRGVRRSIGDISRGVSYYPYDLVGAPVDLINMALTPVGLGSEQPVLGSDYLRNIAQSLGFAQPSTGSGAETAGRFGAAFVNPAAGARAVGQLSQGVTRGANLSADRLVQMITGNPQATAPRVLEETSMPFMQAVAPKAPAVPGLMEPAKSDTGFYSQLEAATIPLQNKGTGDQYLAQIQKSAGVKPEEIQWTGLDEFLKGKKSVTKTEIQDYLNANRVDVREVRLGFSEEQGKEFYRQDNIKWFSSMSNEQLAAEAGLSNANEIASNPTLRQAVINDLVDVAMQYYSPSDMPKSLGVTKFSEYTLPGGENYREILLTMPARERVVETQVPAGKRPKVFEDTATGRFELLDSYGETRAVFNTRAEAEKAADEAAAPFVKSETVKDPEFYSTHFDRPNILAHMRVNDRVVDGKKTLFIEEIQSDWHQAGRKKGYQQNLSQDDVKNLLANEGYDVNYNGANWVVSSKTGGAVPNKLAGGESNSQFAGNLNQVAAMVLGRRDLMPYSGSGVGAVPDAPFKTSWHELTLKRAIQEASEKGYDQIAFTTGKTQAERYDLSKQVNKIDVEAVEEVPNLYFVDVDVAGGKTLNLEVENGIVRNDEFAGKALEDVVGKEIAEKVMSVQQGKTQRLSGDDLRIGGEGMKGFYDNILPKSLEKLGKKFDAKVGKTEMDGVEVWQMDITPQMRESVTTKGQPLFAVPAVGAGLLGAGMYQDEQMF